MSETNLQTPTPAQGPEPVPTPQVAPEPSPQQANRDSINQRYQQMYQAPEPAAAPAPEPVVTPPAEPQPDALQAVLDRLAAMEAKLSTPAPQAAPAAPPDPNAAKDWLDLLSSGDKAAAEAKLRETLAVPNGPELVAQAVEQFRAEQDLNEFTRDIQTKNADLMSMEPLIAAAVKVDVERAFAGKQRPTPSEYVAAYKSAVTTQVENARKLVLEFRGQGATNASTRTTQVLASPTLIPAPVNSNRESPTAPAAPETTSDYLAQRQSLAAARRGLTPRA